MAVMVRAAVVAVILWVALVSVSSAHSPDWSLYDADYYKLPQKIVQADQGSQCGDVICIPMAINGGKKTVYFINIDGSLSTPFPEAEVSSQIPFTRMSATRMLFAARFPTDASTFLYVTDGSMALPTKLNITLTGSSRVYVSSTDALVIDTIPGRNDYFWIDVQTLQFQHLSDTNPGSTESFCRGSLYLSSFDSGVVSQISRESIADVVTSPLDVPLEHFVFSVACVSDRYLVYHAGISRVVVYDTTTTERSEMTLPGSAWLIQQVVAFGDKAYLTEEQTGQFKLYQIDPVAVTYNDSFLTLSTYSDVYVGSNGMYFTGPSDIYYFAPPFDVDPVHVLSMGSGRIDPMKSNQVDFLVSDHSSTQTILLKDGVARTPIEGIDARLQDQYYRPICDFPSDPTKSIFGQSSPSLGYKFLLLTPTTAAFLVDPSPGPDYTNYLVKAETEYHFIVDITTTQGSLLVALNKTDPNPSVDNSTLLTSNYVSVGVTVLLDDNVVFVVEKPAATYQLYYAPFDDMTSLRLISANGSVYLTSATPFAPGTCNTPFMFYCLVNGTEYLAVTSLNETHLMGESSTVLNGESFSQACINSTVSLTQLGHWVHWTRRGLIASTALAYAPFTTVSQVFTTGGDYALVADFPSSQLWRLDLLAGQFTPGPLNVTEGFQSSQFRSWVLNATHNVIAYRAVANSYRRLMLVNILTNQATELMSTTSSIAKRAMVHLPTSTALVDPNGQLQVCDLHSAVCTPIPIPTYASLLTANYFSNGLVTVLGLSRLSAPPPFAPLPTDSSHRTLNLHSPYELTNFTATSLPDFAFQASTTGAFPKGPVQAVQITAGLIFTLGPCQTQADCEVFGSSLPLCDSYCNGATGFCRCGRPPVASPVTPPVASPVTPPVAAPSGSNPPVQAPTGVQVPSAPLPEAPTASRANSLQALVFSALALALALILL